MIEIREFGDDDYTPVAGILVAHHPEGRFSVDGLRLLDRQMGPKYKLRRWVGVASGEVVGFCQVNHARSSFDPDEFWVNVAVHPDHLRKGYGAALYDHLLSHVLNENPKRLRATIKEDDAGGTAFATKHGFEEYAQRFDSVLDVQNADLTPFLASLGRVAARGIEIKTHAELMDAPDFARNMYELNQMTRHDIPYPDPITEELTLEEFRDFYLTGPDRLHEGSFVAVDGDDYVGITANIKTSPDVITVAYTGVRRDYRRKGVATALKLRGIQYAREHGYKTMSTVNDTANEAMLRLNTALGFVRQAATVLMVKQL